MKIRGNFKKITNRLSELLKSKTIRLNSIRPCELDTFFEIFSFTHVSSMRSDRFS